MYPRLTYLHIPKLQRSQEEADHTLSLLSNKSSCTESASLYGVGWHLDAMAILTSKPCALPERPGPKHALHTMRSNASAVKVISPSGMCHRMAAQDAGQVLQLHLGSQAKLNHS